jgi:NAD(P)-dependent dehydrogenase (short-subunit alcohol dehydrogenase family)
MLPVSNFPKLLPIGNSLRVARLPVDVKPAVAATSTGAGQMSRIALITGANRGIGYETARQLAEAGVFVLVAARSRDKAVAAALKLQGLGLPAEALELDVTDAASIDTAAREVRRKHRRLDILINNAGVMHDDATKPVSAQSLEVWRSTFDTNLFGVIAVTQAFLPLLREAPAGRIVNLSSILGSNTLHATPGSPIYDFKVPAYNVSKTALNGWTVQLAYELRDTPVKVNAAHPGHVQTDMGGADAPMAIVDGAKTSVRLALLPADGPSGGYFHMDQTLPW